MNRFRVMLYIFVFCAAYSSAQKFRPFPFRQLPVTLPQSIIVEDRKLTKLYWIKIGMVLDFTVSDVKYRWGRISRIEEDSIFFKKARFRFDQIDKIALAPFVEYSKNDTVRWCVYFPPDSIYQSYRSFTYYKNNLVKSVKKRKQLRLVPDPFNNAIKLNIPRIANLEIAVSYERRLTARWTLEAELGYKFLPKRNRYIMYDVPIWAYKGPSVLIGPKYYLRNNIYLQPMFHYKYLEMKDGRTDFPGNSLLHQDQYRTDLGLSMRFGVLRRIFKTGILDGYAGLGLKVCLVHQIADGHYPYHDSGHYNPINPPEVSDYQVWQPIINLGFKIGNGW